MNCKPKEGKTMSKTRYCNICKQEMGSEVYAHICRSCSDTILNIEIKIDEMKL
jgi:hypothetical protein